MVTRRIAGLARWCVITHTNGNEAYVKAHRKIIIMEHMQSKLGMRRAQAAT
jgi:hypothetical protein